MKTLQILFICSFLLFLASCGKKPDLHPIPEVYVYEQIQTNDPRYTNLNLLGGYAYLDAGYKGIVVIRSFDERLYAMDRACTFHPTEACAQVTVDSSSVYMRCGKYENEGFTACCNSRYYTSGDVLEGPATYPLKHYRVDEMGALITISSD